MTIALDTLAYALRLREAGFSEQQAHGQAEALAAAMTDALATRADLIELEARLESRFAWIDLRFEKLEARFQQVDARFDQMEARFQQVDARFVELERRMDLRLAEHSARYEARLADMERRITLRLGGMMVATATAVSALARLL